MSTIPMCFVSPRMFDLWLQAAKVGPEQQRCTNPCHDCTPTYQRRMKQTLRCAHPETMFSVDAEGAVYGFWPRAS